MNNCLLKSYQCLMSIYVDRAFSTIQLNKVLLTSKPSDRPLITKIVYGVLDNDIHLQYIIGQFTKKTKVNVRIMLSIGTYCLMHLSMPTYAVVNDTAELAKVTEDTRIVGFVNATLKSIATALDNNTIVYPDDIIQRTSVLRSYPMWAMKKLVKDYGKEQALDIVNSTGTIAKTIRINTDKISVVDFIKLLDDNGIQHSATILEDCIAVAGKINIDSTLYTHMSLASMMIARSVATEGKCRVLDCCSAPGGKAIYIKQLNNNAHVTACDIHQHRVDLIDSYRTRMGVDIDTVCCDSTVYNAEWDSAFDYVLCDVPCSGFGVLDSNPDIKLFREEVDVSNLMKLQQAILSNCSRYVKVGGVLVYSTCTLFDNENSQNIDKFLRVHNDFALDALPQAYYKGASMYQFLPNVDNTQAFFVARLVRR